jgi:hypothetical protein
VDEMEIVNPKTGKNRYKLHADGVVTPAPEEKKTTCFFCNGTGQTCDTWGEAEGVCDCLNSGSSPTFSDCEDCKGTGK